ncbi:MAG: hypothetical protein JW709_11505 [Sedimentisphaerales bacterium]|nr:hypothetical protein [Sedimentisphaerales bacterium]
MHPPVRPGWLLAAGIGAGVMWLVLGTWSRPNTAAAQIDIGANGDIVVVPMQMTPSTNGFILVDKLHQTICLYEYRHHASAADRQGLVLVAARSYRHDTQLEDYNTAPPRPDDVKQLLLHAEKLRQEQSAPKKTPAAIEEEVAPSPGVEKD